MSSPSIVSKFLLDRTRICGIIYSVTNVTYVSTTYKESNVKRKAPRILGNFELEIMHVIWSKGRATVQEVKDALSEAHPGAYSTFITIMRRMEEKGILGHEMHEDGRTFVYKPLVSREEVSRSMFRDIYHRLFLGSSERLQNAMDALFREEEITPEGIQRLRKLIVEKGEQDE